MFPKFIQVGKWAFIWGAYIRGVCIRDGNWVSYLENVYAWGTYIWRGRRINGILRYYFKRYIIFNYEAT